jgi:cobalt-zinc-cadmium efflux system membrane fusion protein
MSIPIRFTAPAFAVVTLLICSVITSCSPVAKDISAQTVAENVVPVSTESAKELDLRTEPVARRSLATDLHVTGRIQAEVSKEIDVSPRFTGRVVALLVKAGDSVKAGQPLAKVDSQEVSELEAELIEAQSKYEIAKAHEERERQIYQERLQRPKELLSAQSEYDQIKVQLQLADAEYKRTEDLYKEKIASGRDFQKAKATVAQLRVQFREAEILLQREQSLFKNKSILMRDLLLARAETVREKQHVDTLKQRLVLLGMPAPMVAKVLSSNRILPSVPILSPTSGIVTDQKTAVGEIVSPDKRIILVTDLSTVVMSADIPEIDVSQVRLGAPVEIKVAAFPKQKFSGTISFVSDAVNPTTRTVAIRASLPNPKLRLKTNMFAEIDLPGVSAEVLSCPKSAIQERAGIKVVYVATTGGYEEHRIEVGRDFGDYVEVTSGLKEGEEVATQGSLLLRTAMATKQTQQ